MSPGVSALRMIPFSQNGLASLRSRSLAVVFGKTAIYALATEYMYLQSCYLSSHQHAIGTVGKVAYMAKRRRDDNNYPQSPKQ